MPGGFGTCPAVKPGPALGTTFSLVNVKSLSYNIIKGVFIIFEVI
jgi:hypothetical protein